MDKENNMQDGFKLVFSLISLFLMMPLLINGDESYYRTLFIFLINRVIEMFFKSNGNESRLFIVWALVNQWFGVIASAFAFCSIVPDFAQMCMPYSRQINFALFTVASSCVLKEMLVLVVRSVKEHMVKNTIRNDFN